METLKNIGWCLLGIAIFIVVSILTFLLIRWGSGAAAIVIPYVNWASGIVFTICLLLLLPLAIFKKTRGIAGVGLFISSYIFGLSTWLSGFLITYSLWGVLGVIIGVFLAGIGVIATAIIALLIHGEWSLFGIMLLNVALIWGSRILGVYLAEKAENEKVEVEILEEDTTNTQAERFCRECGKEISPTASFCKHCGVKINEK